MSDELSITSQMLQRSARLAAGERGEEAWDLVNLFQHSQPRELLQICHYILATFLELNYEYFDEGWPLISRLNVGATEHPINGTFRSRLLRCQKRGQFRSRSPCRNTFSPMRHSAEDTEDLLKVQLSHLETATREADVSMYVTPKRRSKMGWLRGRAMASQKFSQLLPSKPSLLSTPTSISLTSPAPMSIEQVLRIGKSPSCTLLRNPARSPNQFFPWENSGKHSPLSSSENPDYTLCRYIIDFMLDSPEILSTEGLFRRPGNQSRIKNLHDQLKESVVTEYLSISQPSPSQTINSLDSPHIFHRRTDVYSLLSSAHCYDVASVLLRFLAPHNGLVHPSTIDLFFQTTQLQYLLADQKPVYSLHPSEDWIHLLCHGRQILAYRIIIQLLLPPPERRLLLQLLSLLHKIASNTQKTRMSPEALARCLVIAVFGFPSSTDPMGCYIDTLINLIELYEELETLPTLVYKEVRAYLRSKLGTSPLKPVSDLSSKNSVDSVAMRRSWTTSRISLDVGTRATTAPLTISNQLFDAGSTNKENRGFLFTHLCIWTKSDDESSQKPKSPSKKEGQVVPRSTSPFLIWKKQRTTGKHKTSQDDVHHDHTSKKTILAAK